MDSKGVKSGRVKANKSSKILAVIAALIIAFIFGVNVGDGSFAFGPGGAFRSSVAEDAPEDLSYDEVEDLYDSLRRNYDGRLDAEKLMEGIKDGLAGATGDVYTEYLSPKEAKSFNDDLNGTFSGIGAELSKDKQFIVIVSPISGFPAADAGLQPKDIIAEINDESALDMGLTEAVNKIRGPAGTKVKLTIIRDNEELNFNITRAQITIPSVESEIKDGNIGYIQVGRFSDDTAALVQKAANQFKGTGVKGVILDLRSNPGGLLDSSVDVSGIWLDEGKTVLKEKRGGVTIDTMVSPGPGTLKGVPTIVLINEGSASASEIVAGALKDNGAATLLGKKSFGKGSVQQLVNLPDEGVLKVTIARWYTPAGKNIDKDGIKPDETVDRTSEDITNDRDPQLDAALKNLQR